MKFSDLKRTVTHISAIVLALLITVGCAGINSPNLSEIEEYDSAAVTETADLRSNSRNIDGVPVLGGSGEEEDIHVIRPDHD